ncbi:MAG: hypothetical protein R2880_11110 [Deinococcales bacterium]
MRKRLNLMVRVWLTPNGTVPELNLVWSSVVLQILNGLTTFNKGFDASGNWLGYQSKTQSI